MSGVSLTAPTARPAPAVRRDIILPALIFAAFALLPVIAALTSRQYLVDVGARMMVFAVAAVALDLLVGYAGLISFGHAAFIGLGAYAVGILSAHGIGEGLIALPAAILVAMLFAWATGIVCLRTRGAYFIMITLAFGQMVYFIATSLAPYGGDNGLTVAARSTIARFGRVLRGGKENAVRMAAIGFNVRRFQLVAYVIAGGLGGFSGFLLANLTEFVAPAYMSWQQSGELIVMVILGGAGTLDGGLLGSAAYLLAEEWLSGFTENWKVIFGPILVLVVLFARGGLIGLGAWLWRRLGHA
jgi:branched-chain amino acid transport system permease protein